MRPGRIAVATSAGLLVAAAAALWTIPNWLVDALATWYPGCLYRTRSPEPRVALTIDDGPDPFSTPLILAELRREGVRATFFLIGERVSGQEKLVRKLAAEGHELGNHGARDHPAILLSRDAFETDLLRAHEALARFGPVTWARPGSGWYSREMIEIMQRHGYRCALGSVYPLDATIPWELFAVRYILRNVRPGAVLVLHDGRTRGLRTARVLREVLPELRRRGYAGVTLSALIAGSSGG
jgi:peptidoglycan/xylan/chitin deacetylase (PgdA/CDA1 family)